MSNPAITHFIESDLTPWRVVEREFFCSHPATAVRCKTDSIGRTQYVNQCLRCGDAVGAFLKHSSIRNRESIQPFDVDLQENYRAARRQRQEELSQAYYPLRDKIRREDYDTYINSPEWKRKREKVLARDKYLCQACLSRAASDVHHLTYKHFKNEPLFELISVCRPCHEKIHNLERKDGVWAA